MTGVFEHLCTVPDINEIAPSIPRGDATNRDGLQDAHIQATKFWNDNFGGLMEAIDPDGAIVASSRHALLREPA